MDTSTERSDWRAVLREQGRTMQWLASATGKSPRTVYAYSRGNLIPPPEWLADVSRLLGVEVFNPWIRVPPVQTEVAS